MRLEIVNILAQNMRRPMKIDPDTSPGEKLLRLFRKLMLDGRCHYQSDLANELKCSLQTISRMVDTIENVVGTAIQRGSTQRRHWFQYVTSSKNNFGLDYEELRFLGICRDMASGVLPTSVLERVDGSIRKIALQMTQMDPTQNPDKQFFFYPKGRVDYEPHANSIEILVGAIRKSTACIVNYIALGKTTVRSHNFLPVRLIAMNNALYALGAQVSEDFAEIIRPCNLAVHRISKIKATKHHLTFTPDDDGMLFGLPWHEPRTFCIRFSPSASAYVRERIWSDSQHMQDTEDGGLLLTITTKSEPELQAWVRSFGDQAQFCDIQAESTPNEG